MRWLPLLPLALLTAACGADAQAGDAPEPDTTAAVDPIDLLDPASCAACHPDHYREWAASMHAYASTDPVFRAMDVRGQEDTDGELGTACLSCHAPLAVALGLVTDDDVDIPAIPDWAQGVTCAFCHRVTAIDWSEDPPVHLGDPDTFFGALDAPVANEAHGSQWSALHDRRGLDSAELCSACHDRSYLEWTQTVFHDEDPLARLTCGDCHMPAREGLAAAVEGAPTRVVHSHLVPGVDVALGPWPDAELLEAEVQRSLDSSIRTRICVHPAGSKTFVVISLENIASGHDWPSCSKDRRAWVELKVWSADGQLLLHSGDAGDDVALSTLDDEQLWVIGDHFYGEDGQPVLLPWEAVGFEKGTLPGPTTLDPADPLWVDPHQSRSYTVASEHAPALVELEVHLRPLPLDLVDELVGSGHLDPSIREAVPTWTLAYATRAWQADDGITCSPEVW